MSQPSAARQAVALATEGRTAEALALLDRAAGAGDGEAMFARGLWRVDGRLLPRDLAAAREDFRIASDAGHVDGGRVHAGFLATGTGGPRDWPGALAALETWADRDPMAARQRALIDDMAIDDQGDPASCPASEILRETPHIALFRQLFTEPECALLAELAASRFRPALIFHEGQKRFVRDPIRDSDAAGFQLVTEWPFVHALNRRIAAATGTEIAQGETLQLLRYAPGQQYRPHLDAVPGMANQRILTALVFLNQEYQGGETDFLDLGLAVKGRTGDMLLFANALPDGRPDPRTRHAGRPLIAGTKLIASRWIRQRPPEDPARGFGQHEAEAPRSA